MCDPAAANDSPDVHVLFVHGVGEHSHLSSLLRAYQSLRADTSCPEAPVRPEDPIPGWRLVEFSQDGAGVGVPWLLLGPDDGSEEGEAGPTAPGEPRRVFLYEVNYSELAGVIRRNHRLDLTTLFVGLDLAVAIARGRLATHPPRAAASTLDHAALARVAQQVAGVLVALTVPILGLPSLLLRRFTGSFVSLY